MKTYYTVYKITNRVNKRFYIGSHRTTKLDDGYMGSGILLKRAFKKYGIENFDKEILSIFDNSEEMFAEEARIVDKDDPQCYNLREGGHGGFGDLNDSSPKHIERCKRNYQSTLALGNISEYGKIGGKAAAKLHRKNKTGFFDPSFARASFKGKHHSNEVKEKISAGGKKRLGKNNGSFGTMWVTNGSESKKIKKHDPIPEGWRRGVRNRMEA